MLDKNFILINLSVSSSEDVIRALCSLLEKAGNVDENYVSAVIERESHFPTGLPTDILKIAIPHAGRDHINRSSIAAAKLDSPVPFKSMEGTDEILYIEFVILLAISDSEKQIDMLQKLMNLIQDKKNLIALKNARNKEDIVSVFASLE